MTRRVYVDISYPFLLHLLTVTGARLALVTALPDDASIAYVVPMPGGDREVIRVFLESADFEPVYEGMVIPRITLD